jgi:hypothetical protein
MNVRECGMRVRRVDGVATVARGVGVAGQRQQQRRGQCRRRARASPPRARRQQAPARAQHAQGACRPCPIKIIL